MVFVQLLDSALPRQCLARLPQAPHEVSGSGEQDAVAVFDEDMTECGSEMRLAGAGWAEQQGRAGSVDPAVASAVTCARLSIGTAAQCLGSVGNVGVTSLSPGAGLSWGRSQRGDRIPRRARHCRPHTLPAAAGQRLVETIASAGICSSAD